MGWVIIPVSSSSGLRPRPLAGMGLRREKGGAAMVMTERKKAMIASMTASTQG